MSKEEVLEKLNKYFKYDTNCLLEILDIPSKTAAERGGYTGVTLSYLREYVVPKISLILLVECINELLRDEIISKIKCSNIDRVVIEKFKNDYRHYRSDETQKPLRLEDIAKSKLSLAKQYKTDRQLLDEEE